MNINAGTNSYNLRPLRDASSIEDLSLKKMKEEKRPTFATIFDKLDARSKKLNPKNPLNAVLTNDQMYRYYLKETEPLLSEEKDDFDLDDTIGGKSLRDMKLSEFAKLLSGNLDNDRNVKYETLTATITPTPAAPIVPSMISIATPPSAPSAPSAPIIPAPSSSVATSIAAPVAVSGLMPSPPTPPPTTAAAAPIIPAPSSSVATSIAAPVAVSGLMPSPPASSATAAAAPAPAPAAAGSGGSSGTGTGGRGLTISTAPPVAGLTGLLSALSPASLIRAGGSAVSSAISSVVSAKPSPSGASIPSTAVASGATTAVATTVGTGVAPTPTPISGVSGALSPVAAGGSSGTGTAAGAVSPSGAEIAAVALTVALNAGYKKIEDQQAYIDGLEKGLTPPEKPATLKRAVDIEDKDWVKYTIELINYNETADKPFSLGDKQKVIAKNYERALAAAVDVNDLDNIIENTISLATIKPAGGAKSGKGKKKK